MTLSFEGVSSLTSAFLNAAIGQLYGVFKASEVRAKLRPRNLRLEDRAVLRRVVEVSKAYFKDPERFRDTARDLGVAER